MTVIRQAKVDDARELALLLREIGWFKTFNQGEIDALAEQVKARLEQCLIDDSHLVLVAENADGKIAAYISAHWLPYLFMSGPEGYVSELFVSADARGHGVGRLLLGTIEQEARARGCQRLSLTNLRNRESYQRQFYSKAGWRERSEAANFIYPLS
jgi:GNAT superfamily N-acetyltransferase